MYLSWIVEFGTCILSIAFVYFGIPFLYGRYLRLKLKHRAEKLRALVLTFDDGPGRRLTPRVLSLLAESNARATFFLLGRNIQGNENLVQLLNEGNHEVCSHGYEHLHYWKVSPWRAISDIVKGWKSINQALGSNVRSYPFRPPGGKLNVICLLFLLLNKVPVIFWTVVSGDTFLTKQLSRRVNLLEYPEDLTGVILVHDFDRDNEKAESEILDWLRTLLVRANRNNIRILTVSELLDNRHG